MSNATKATQLLLNEAGASLKVDGMLGDNTMNAIYAQPTLSVVISTMNKGFDQAAALKVRPPEAWVPETVISGYVEKAAKIAGFGADTLKWMLNIEAVRKREGGNLYYNPRSMSPSRAFKGLGQLNEKSWSDAQKYAILAKTGYTLKPFNAAWYDPESSIVAMALYSKMTEVYVRDLLRKAGRPQNVIFTPEVRYACYNQGPGFIANWLKGDMKIVGNQSPLANGAINIARRQLSVQSTTKVSV